MKHVLSWLFIIWVAVALVSWVPFFAVSALTGSVFAGTVAMVLVWVVGIAHVVCNAGSATVADTKGILDASDAGDGY